jgi:hypothetical protein
MRKVYLFFVCCIVATSLTLNVVLAHETVVNPPNTIKDIEPYISDRALGFVLKLENNCPIREQLRSFFEKLKDLLKLESSVTPLIEDNEPKTFKFDLKSKSENLLQTMFMLGRGLVSYLEQKYFKAMNINSNVNTTKNILHLEQSKF